MLSPSSYVVKTFETALDNTPVEE